MPFQRQRSFCSPDAPALPPNSITSARPRSNAIAQPVRGDGPPDAANCQLVPFHVRVSGKALLTMSVPPNCTHTQFDESYAIAPPHRGRGSSTAGDLGGHDGPAHSHVSPNTELAALPPNSTTRDRMTSVAIWNAQRGGGVCAGVRSIQCSPSQRQQSASNAFTPERPPNSS